MSKNLSRYLVTVAIVGIVGAVPLPALADEKPSNTKQQDRHFEKEITVKVKLDYLLYLPEGYDKEEKAWPLLLFLHGAGERGDVRQHSRRAALGRAGTPRRRAAAHLANPGFAKGVPGGNPARQRHAEGTAAGCPWRELSVADPVGHAQDPVGLHVPRVAGRGRHCLPSKERRSGA